MAHSRDGLHLTVLPGAAWHTQSLRDLIHRDSCVHSCARAVFASSRSCALGLSPPPTLGQVRKLGVDEAAIEAALNHKTNPKYVSPPAAARAAAPARCAWFRASLACVFCCAPEQLPGGGSDFS